MKILVTGGNGFIGYHVVENLLRKGHQVTVFDRFEKQPYPWKNVNRCMGDIKDIESVMGAVSVHDATIHLAGVLGTAESVTSPLESVESNITGAINVYEAIKKFSKPAVAITVGNYTWNNTYAITKYTAERFALMYNKEFGTKIAIVRGLNVYGPRQKHAPVKKVVPNFVLRALLNKDIEIFGDGEQLLDLIFVEDTAEILSRALLLGHKVYSGVFEAGSGDLVSANTLATSIIRIAKSKSKIIHLPMRPGEPTRSITQGDPGTLEPLGFRKQDFTKLDNGLKTTIAWYKKYYLPELDSSSAKIIEKSKTNKNTKSKKHS